jgi:hypothetical protein
VQTLLPQQPELEHQPDSAAVVAVTADDVETALEVADCTFHFGAMLLRTGIYVALAIIADNFDFGPHLLAGVLFGDFAGYATGSLRQFRAAPVAAGAELVMFTMLFVFWWWRYAWPEAAEFRALFYLGGFGALTARVASAFSSGQKSLWD